MSQLKVKVKLKLLSLLESVTDAKSILNPGLEKKCLELITSGMGDEILVNMLGIISQELDQLYQNFQEKRISQDPGNRIRPIDEDYFRESAKLLLSIAIYYVDRKQEKPKIDVPGFMEFHGDAISSILQELEMVPEKPRVDGGGNKKKRKRTKRRKSKRRKSRRRK